MKRLLVANRGEIAVRVLSAARELDFCAVAIYIENDTSHVAHANEAIRLPAAKSFLDIDHLVRVCQDHKIDAVHPGYGFLSESSDFAAKLHEAGVIFVGPTPEILRSTGDKLSARRLAEECDVPVLPALKKPTKKWSDVEAFASQVGYPVMLKAVDGGGGRGIRLARGRSDLEAAFERAQAESPSNSIFAEKAAIDGWRHIEVQVLGDGSSVRHFWERECSIQRRYQKVVELAPSTLPHGELRSRIIASALRIARKIRYKSLGTFEFLASPDRHEYYFMEINPRLQVEHTITEAITSTDLVRIQLQIANGFTFEKLGLDTPKESDPPPALHAIQLRVTAEDPRADFALSIGRIKKVAMPSGNGIRVDTHTEAGTQVSTDFDSLLSKIIVSGGDFSIIVSKALRALDDTTIDGVTTNIELLRGILLSKNFQAKQCDTCWLENNVTTTLEAGSAYERHRKRPANLGQSQATASMPTSNASTVAFKKGDTWDLTLTHPQGPAAGSQNIRIMKIMRNDFPQSFAAEITISSSQSSHSDSPYTFNIQQTSSSDNVEGSRDLRRGDKSNPAHLVCPLSGQLVEVLVDEGDQVQEFEAVAIIRQMKMELEVRAHRSGTVGKLWQAEEGENVEAGALVCEIMTASGPREKL